MHGNSRATPGRVALGAFKALRKAPEGSSLLGRATWKKNDFDLMAVIGDLVVRVQRLERQLEDQRRIEDPT